MSSAVIAWNQTASEVCNATHNAAVAARQSDPTDTECLMSCRGDRQYRVLYFSGCKVLKARAKKFESIFCMHVTFGQDMLHFK